LSAAVFAKSNSDLAATHASAMAAKSSFNVTVDIFQATEMINRIMLVMILIKWQGILYPALFPGRSTMIFGKIEI
jgi:hypothetical protein